MDWRGELKRRCALFVLPLILSLPLWAQSDDEYVVFKLIVNQEEVGQIETIFRPEGIYVSLLEGMEKLGYRFDYDAARGRFSTYCPDKDHPIRLHADTLYTVAGQQLLPDSLLIIRPQNLYLRSDYFVPLCGIRLEVVFQSLKIIIKSDQPFPFEALYQQTLRQQKFKSSREKYKQEEVDSIPLSKLRLNTLGYALAGSVSKSGFDGYDALLSTNSEVLRGALNLNYNYSAQKTGSRQEFNFRHTYEYDHRWLRQLAFFRQPGTVLMSDLDGYANGVYLSNDNALFFNRRYYLYKTKTRPNANVEIYSNGELASFVTSDSLGNVEAIVPVMEGMNNLAAAVVNEYGQSVSSEQSVYISPDMLPRKQFRYQFSSGVSDSGLFFSGLTAEYGVSAFLTVSARAEALLKEKHPSALLGAGFKLMIWQWLQLGAEYYPEVKQKFLLTGTTNRYLGYTLTYEQYRKGQQLLPLAPLKDMRLSISSELPFRHLQNGVSFSLRDLRYTAGTSFSSSLRVNIFKGSFLFAGQLTTASQKSFRFENLAYGVRIGYRFKQDFYNELNYDRQPSINEHSFRNRFQFKLANNLQGNATASYYVRSKYISADVGVTYRLPWVTLRGGARSSFPEWGVNAGVEGSVRLYPNHKIECDNRNSAGASLHVAVFADINGNLSYDKGEPILSDAKVLLKTGAEISRKPSGIYFRNIAPGHAFRVIVPRQPLSDISWQITPFEKVLYLSPGQSHSLYVPVQVISEIAGEVYGMEKGKRKPMRGVKIRLVRQSDNYTITERTDEWGCYYFNSLTAGTYTLEPQSDHPALSFKGQQRTVVVPEGAEGIQLEGISFESTPRASMADLKSGETP